MSRPRRCSSRSSCCGPATSGAVIANTQTGGAETTEVISRGGGAVDPRVEFSETLPDGQTYLSWMQANIDALAGALDQ